MLFYCCNSSPQKQAKKLYRSGRYIDERIIACDDVTILANVCILAITQDVDTSRTVAPKKFSLYSPGEAHIPKEQADRDRAVTILGQLAESKPLTTSDTTFIKTYSYGFTDLKGFKSARTRFLFDRTMILAEESLLLNSDVTRETKSERTKAKATVHTPLLSLV